MTARRSAGDCGIYHAVMLRTGTGSAEVKTYLRSSASDSDVLHPKAESQNERGKRHRDRSRCDAACRRGSTIDSAYIVRPRLHQFTSFGEKLATSIRGLDLALDGVC